MAKTNNRKEPQMVQVYDYIREKEYIKRYGGAMIGFEKVIRVDRLEDRLVCKIDCDRNIDEFILNGEEYKLTKI